MAEFTCVTVYPKAPCAGLGPGKADPKMRLNVQEIYWEKYLWEKIEREPEEAQRVIKWIHI